MSAITGLAAFFLAWFGFAFLLRKRKMGWVVSLGASFIGACLFIVIPCAFIGDNDQNRSTASTATSFSGRGPNCQGVIDYYRKAGIPLKEDEDKSNYGVRGSDGSWISYSGQVAISGPGILSSKPVSFICSGQRDGVTIFGTNTLIDKDRPQEALKAIASIFLVDSRTVHPTDQQKKFFFDTASRLQPDTDWHEVSESGSHMRIMTAQGSARGDYWLVVDSGN